MGIKYLHSYLESHPSLQHSITFQWPENNPKHSSSANLVVWDCLGWLRRLYRSHLRTTKLLFDFRQMDDECQQIIHIFKLFGFKLIAFIDGYFCYDKVTEKSRRKRATLKNIHKNLKLIKQMHATKSKKETNKLCNKMEFVPSSGYANYLEQSLSRNGCTVYRGSSQSDIDKDIVRFVIDQKDKIYGIMSTDSDFFGFYDLPNHIKLIQEFRTKIKQKTRRLTLHFYQSIEIWKALNLQMNEQRLELIALCGNDFVKKRTKESLLSRCGMDETAINKVKNGQILKIVAAAIVSKVILCPSNNAFKAVKDFYSMSNHQNIRFEANVNVNWMDLKQCNVFHGGFFFHDIEGDKHTIHQKLANIRHVLAKKYLKLDTMTEWIPEYNECKSTEHDNVNVYKERHIDLKQMRFKSDWNMMCLVPKRRNCNEADLQSVVESTLKILVHNEWIGHTQHIALKLQFEIRHSLSQRYGNKWPFYREYKEFKRNGVPRIEDLSAQWLYIELSRLLCWNKQNIHPCIHYLFDGVLYHLFCKMQSVEKEYENDIISQMYTALIDIKRHNRHNRKRHRQNEPHSNHNKMDYRLQSNGHENWYR